jgi:hypothetical protein
MTANAITSPSAGTSSAGTPTADTPTADTPTGADETDVGRPALKVRISSPTAILAVIPVLLGFDPGSSIVVLGMEPDTREVYVVLRYDVPDPAVPALGELLAKDAIDMLSGQRIATAVAVGYGTDAEIAPIMAALRSQAELRSRAEQCSHAARSETGFALVEQLRVAEQRYWSYVCENPECCPPEGTPFDVADHPAARALRAARGRVLAGRAELAASVAAQGGRTGVAMRRATRESLAQLGRCLSSLERAGAGVSAARLTAALGQIAVRDAIERYRVGWSAPVEHAAFLTVALSQLRVRDDAWARMDPAYRAAHLRLWTDLTRLARPGYVAAPASLLAFVAWQSGNGALGNVAVDRALADNPYYSMAELIRAALDSGAPPSAAVLPMTPEEVAAAYDAQEAAAEAAAAEAAAEAGGAVDGVAAGAVGVPCTTDDPPCPPEPVELAVAAGEAGESGPA